MVARKMLHIRRANRPLDLDMLNFNVQSPRPLPRLGAIMPPDANSFGVLRLMMAVFVLISHSFLYAFGTDAAEPLTALTGHSLGEHAVQIFFILSGILVAQSLDRSRSIVDFATARVLRIFPGLIVCVLLTALLLGPFVSSLPVSTYFTSGALPGYLLKTLSLSTGNAHLPGVFEGVPLSGSVNTSLWTLKYEVLCYAALAAAGVVGLFRPRLRSLKTVLLCGFLCLIFIADPKPVDTYTFADNARYFSLYFGTGVLAYLVRDKLVIWGGFLVPLAVLFGLALGSRFAEFATATLLGYAVVWAASKPCGPLRGFCNRIDLSFGVYIYAGPIQQALIDGAPGLHPFVIAALAAIVVVPLALLSWVLIEQPSLRLRHRLRWPQLGRVNPQRIAALLA
jgi:peptidoglycan/LPS O-acetylase OafA/YrhL